MSPSTSENDDIDAAFDQLEEMGHEEEVLSCIVVQLKLSRALPVESPHESCAPNRLFAPVSIIQRTMTQVQARVYRLGDGMR
jgi:hypothetical protein